MVEILTKEASERLLPEWLCFYGDPEGIRIEWSPFRYYAEQAPDLEPFRVICPLADDGAEKMVQSMDLESARVRYNHLVESQAEKSARKRALGNLLRMVATYAYDPGFMANLRLVGECLEMGAGMPLVNSIRSEEFAASIAEVLE